jgi:peroxiredoxin
MAQKPCNTNSYEVLSIRQPILEGMRIDVGDFRQRANVVIFFVGKSSYGCKNLVGQFATHPSDLDYTDARVLVIVPDEQIAQQLGVQSPYLHYLIDEKEKITQQYRSLVEDEVKTAVMLFILDRFGVPWAAWVGKEPDDRTWKEVWDWLVYISIQCPE